MKTLLLLTTLFLFTQDEFDLPRYATRKVERAIDKEWPDKEVSADRMEMSNEALRKAGWKNEGVDLYQLETSGELMGYLLLEKAPSKSRKFDYLILYNRDLIIRKVRVLIYRENYGGEISNKRWLKQFQGKGPEDEVSYQNNIDGISGATISARSITRSVSTMNNRMERLMDQGLFSSK